MPLLSEFYKNTTVRITNINCGADFCRRLDALGLFEDTEVEIIKNDNFGPLVIKILNSKIALGRGEADKIYAEEI
ncbi:hypothetical protein COW94_00060 [Candidatus Peregrinibacteria bacterium CG22_combo_CG10-13_8_21_14_all_44_10]|nr:MAG: hypothetical protein AUK45_05255 [Candidatus Peregrinibacteria bacterium CG2_30_44_17]PIP66754.1 MAG: hypothetical protein COW94_00060 [Candidatus Peregrinibacteria bacterium CG22_combo_CG10-13_8_21_14_all_44_10]PIX79480.1 MAG: hypothetical protein COZ35_03495 [Candidatus Peregrinibacteria bacterium CG_4_10_14_3_um_filter_44_21]PJB88701.1 MAG: hypothetical protein CO082_03625 [Candidatus Peregrinibacteria bacterium CG_4_9_14_0_8_um_filter_44_15]